MKNKSLVLTVILVSYFMILLDNSIVFTGATQIAHDLTLTTRDLSWVSNAYSLTFGGLLLFSGRAGDVFGRNKIFNIGLIVFGISSLLVGLSTSVITIIGFRAIQGIGAAIIAPTSLALLMDNYTGVARTKAVGYYGATAGIGASIGLILGGVFASYLTWRVGFFMNFPIALLMLIIAHFKLQKSAQFSISLDGLGSILSVIGTFLVVYGIVGSKYNAISLIIGIGILIVFILWEAHVAQPLMPLRIFKSSTRSGAYLARFLLMGGLIPFWFLIPQMMQRSLGYTPLMSGFAFFPLTIIGFIIPLRITEITQKFGEAETLFVGILLDLLGLVGFIFFHQSLGYWVGIGIPMILLGLGQGLLLSPLTSIGIEGTNPEDAGASSGVINSAHQLGGSFGLAIITVLTSSFQNPLVSFDHAMLWASVFNLLALIVTVFMIVLPNKRTKYKN
ncbi:MFS transporter [Dellaglioa sp. L3N]